MIAIALVLAATLNTAKIEELIGLKGKLDEKEGAFKVSYPRSDIAPTAAGVKLTPPLGLTAWASFSGGGAHTMVMGDMVLTEDQVNAAMSAALDSGLEVTALHNHFFWDSPKVINTMGVNTWAALAGSPRKPSSTATSPCSSRRCRRSSRRSATRTSISSPSTRTWRANSLEFSSCTTGESGRRNSLPRRSCRQWPRRGGNDSRVNVSDPCRR